MYQLLVLGEAANSYVTVSIAALGAGAALNIILREAIKKVEGILKPDDNNGKEFQKTERPKITKKPDKNS